MSEYDKCEKCGGNIHFYCAYINEDYFLGDQDSPGGDPSEYEDENPPTIDEDISVCAHICTQCGHVEDIGIEHPRDLDWARNEVTK